MNKEFNTIDIAIYDYMQGLNFFYKIEVPIDEDVDEWVDVLMTLKGHKHSSCSWSGMSLDDIVDETETPITYQELRAVEDK